MFSMCDDGVRWSHYYKLISKDHARKIIIIKLDLQIQRSHQSGASLLERIRYLMEGEWSDRAGSEPLKLSRTVRNETAEAVVLRLYPVSVWYRMGRYEPSSFRSHVEHSLECETGSETQNEIGRSCRPAPAPGARARPARRVNSADAVYTSGRVLKKREPPAPAPMRWPR
ncbi:hypothetical protein EVAR_88702_1 [Eumeta japonica]|uniref:Uncharacterized protein n=1 Tax=Eumeta variegata TaxID=151549 RepID=A0A4C1Y5E3_EUMVA|nr:hypothetical protein EVAR_88702_1 [Eumeta japonica]